MSCAVSELRSGYLSSAPLENIGKRLPRNDRELRREVGVVCVCVEHRFCIRLSLAYIGTRISFFQSLFVRSEELLFSIRLFAYDTYGMEDDIRAYGRCVCASPRIYLHQYVMLFDRPALYVNHEPLASSISPYVITDAFSGRLPATS